MLMDRLPNRRNLFLAASATSLLFMNKKTEAHSANASGESALMPSLMITPQMFGAKGNGVADDLPAFRMALKHIVDAGGGILYIPVGRYLFDSEFERSNEQNSLLCLPLRKAGVDQHITIRIVGEAAVSAFGPPNSQTGVTIFSRRVALNNKKIRSSLIGFGVVSDTTYWSMLNIQLENIHFQVTPQSGVVPLDFSACANCVLENIAVTVTASPGEEPLSHDEGFVGIKLPTTGNYGIVKARNIYISGFHTGMQHSEHADIEALINLCVIGVDIPKGYSHLAKYKITTQCCSYSIGCSALPFLLDVRGTKLSLANSIFGTLDIERDPNFPFHADFLIRNGSQINGTLFYNVAADPESLYSVEGTGTFNVLVQNVAFNQKTINSDTTISPNGWYFPVFANYIRSSVRLILLRGRLAGQRVKIFGSSDHTIEIICKDDNLKETFRLIKERKNTSQISLSPTDPYNNVVEFIWDGYQWLVEFS